MNVMATSNSCLAEMAAAEAKDTSWIRAEAMMEYFMAIQLTACWLYNPFEERKRWSLGACVFGKFGTVGIDRGLEGGVCGNGVCRRGL